MLIILQAASFIFLDAPVGSGFSYARTPEGWNMSDSEYAEQSYQFLKKVRKVQKGLFDFVSLNDKVPNLC